MNKRAISSALVALAISGLIPVEALAVSTTSRVGEVLSFDPTNFLTESGWTKTSDTKAYMSGTDGSFSAYMKVNGNNINVTYTGSKIYGTSITAPINSKIYVEYVVLDSSNTKYWAKYREIISVGSQTTSLTLSYSTGKVHLSIVPVDFGTTQTPETQSSIAQQVLLNTKIDNSTTVSQLESIVKNSIDTSNYSLSISQTNKVNANESSDGKLEGNIIITDSSNGKSYTTKFSIVIPKLGQSIDTIYNTLLNYCNNYNATNNSKSSDFENAIEITNNDYSISVSDWNLIPATDTTEGSLNCNVNITQKGQNVKTIPISNKKIAKLATTTSTAKEIISNIVKDYNATNSSKENDLLVTLQKAVGNNIAITILNWKLDQSNETTKGSLTGTVSFTDGVTTDTVIINKQIDIQDQSVATVKSLFETVLKNFKATNNTKADDILNAVKITNQDLTVDISDFKVETATEIKSGKIKGNINIKNNNTGDNDIVPIDIKIAQLPQSVITVKNLYEKALQNYVATNDTQKDDFLNLVYVNNEDISISIKNDYDIKYSNDIDKGYVKGTIQIYDKSINVTEEVPINKEIDVLSQSLSTSIKLVQDVIYKYNPNNNSTFDDLLIKCNKVVSKNIDVYYKIGELPEKVESTEFDEGHMKGTIIVTDGTDSKEIPFNIIIAKTPQTLKGAKTLIEAYLKNFNATNDTTEQIVLNAVDTTIRNSDINVSFGSGKDECFNKKIATVFKDGKITGVINVSNKTTTESAVKVPVDLKIDQLDQTISEAEQGINAELPNFIVNNDTEEQDIKKQVEDVVSNNIVVETKDFEKIKATFDTEGQIKVTVILTDQNTTDTKQIPLILTIKQIKVTLESAEQSVEKAEQSKKQEDVNSAQQEINRLPNSQEKNDLQDRLDKVQDIINAQQSVEKAEQSKKQEDVNSAQQEINKLPDSQEKNDLQNRLDEVQKEIDSNGGGSSSHHHHSSNNNSTNDKNNSSANNLDGWQNINGSWHYYGSGVQYTGWKEIDNKWYYFSDNGIMKTGWFLDTDNNWYYLSAEQENLGAMQIGWKEINGKWYYLNVEHGKPLGSMKTGWFLDTDNNWYYLSAEQENLGAMQIGWKEINGKWYYLNVEHGKPLGSMKTGWFLDTDNNWYYLSDSGAMVTGWQKINSNWYYLGSNGVMLKNIIIDGYILGDNGTWIS